MKKISTLLFIALLAPIVLVGQTIPNSFKIINNNHPEKEAFYIASIEKANMENYRLKDKEVILKFDNGFECVMLSAKDLFMIGKSINAVNYQESFPINFSLPFFNILQDGHLMAKYPNKGKISKK
ncbi:MAG: hypothetical protein ACYDCN_06665 [Bacteroidia bacterium]